MMQVSSRTEYGLRCLLLLAKEGKSLSLTQLIQQEHLPRHYVEQILMKLRRAGLIKSTRGTQGGFALARPATTISVAEVVRVLEGVPFNQTCNRFNEESSCGHLGHCGLGTVWDLISGQLWKTMDRITLQQLVQNDTTPPFKELPVLS